MWTQNKTDHQSTLERNFEFIDFKACWAFMTEVAFVAESMNHHPNWSNVYNKVHISLTTHDAGNTVSAKDHALAQAIDQIFASRK